MEKDKILSVLMEYITADINNLMTEKLRKKMYHVLSTNTIPVKVYIEFDYYPDLTDISDNITDDFVEIPTLKDLENKIDKCCIEYVKDQIESAMDDPEYIKISKANYEIEKQL